MKATWVIKVSVWGEKKQHITESVSESQDYGHSKKRECIGSDQGHTGRQENIRE